VNLIAAGEVGGVLDSVLNRLSVYLEKAMKIKRQLKSAMTYPITLLVVAVGVIILMLWKVIPVFENMFKDFGGGSLPAITQFVIDLSKFVGSNIIFIAIIAIGLVVSITAILRSEKGRRAFDKIMLKVPIFGPVIQKFGVARFTRTMGTLLTSGVPILDSLEICAKAAGNYTIQDALLYTRAKISEGKSIAEPLMETRVFPAMVIQMIGVGESTGAMDAMLQKIADFYEDEVDVAVAGLMKMLEPVMFVFLGGICGGLMISMYVPIFELAGAIKAQ
jgi:type IV pilus assembly protein PilC